MQIFLGILIPFLGTTLGSAGVFFMRKSLGVSVQRALAGFAAGVMVAASIWSLIDSGNRAIGKFGQAILFPCINRILGRCAVFAHARPSDSSSSCWE